MAGYNLNSGEYTEAEVSLPELWSSIDHLFNGESMNTTSYKFCFLKSILDNLYCVDDELILTYDKIFSRFTELYWPLIIKYHFRQSSTTVDGKTSAIEGILINSNKMFNLDDYTHYSYIAENIRYKISSEVRKECKKYVIGAVYIDTKKLFYSFSKKEEWIKLNPKMYEFLCKYRTLIEQINNYSWVSFMAQVNSRDNINLQLLLKYLKKNIEITNIKEYLRNYKNANFAEALDYSCNLLIYRSKILTSIFSDITNNY